MLPYVFFIHYRASIFWHWHYFFQYSERTYYFPSSYSPYNSYVLIVPESIALTTPTAQHIWAFFHPLLGLWVLGNEGGLADFHLEVCYCLEQLPLVKLSYSSTLYQNNSSSVKITSNGKFLPFAVLRTPSVESWRGDEPPSALRPW